MATAWTVETGVDFLEDPQTEIHSLHRLYVGYQVSERLSFGQGFYSAASGDAGGAFFWGGEGVASLPLGQNSRLTFGAFLGGGGGASQVTGDGLMVRAHAGYAFDITSKLALQIGGGWVSISGAEIDGASAYIGLTGAQGSGGLLDDVSPRAMSLSAQLAISSSSRTRSGDAQPDLVLFGGEASFNTSGGFEPWLAAFGAADGGEGYMQAMAGVRKRREMPWGSYFVGALAGFGGGGEVDTGGGLLLGAEVGAGLKLSDAFDLELVGGAVTSLDGDFEGLTGALKLTRVFDRGAGTIATLPRMDLTVGLSQQYANSDFMKSASATVGDPVMQETSLDLYFAPRNYVTVNAQTTMGGGVAGYAIGLIGLGREFVLNEKWSASVEAHIGAAGGGGVETSGGLIGGMRAEVDYALNPETRLSFGLGQLSTLKGGGMQPAVFQVGLKFPISR